MIAEVDRERRAYIPRRKGPGDALLVRDHTGVQVEPHTCIFPILKSVGDGVAQLVGTGFFITTIGHFVTAKHVIFDVLDTHHGQFGFLHAAHFVEGTSVLLRAITAVSYHNTADLAIGKMDYHVITQTGEPLKNRVPMFTTEPPPIGSAVVTFAYPKSDRTYFRGAGAIFRSDFYRGRMLAHSEAPRDSSLVTWPHYVTSITILGGASGGPVFDHKGRVFGINCVGGLEGFSYMGRATDLLALSVPEFPRLAEEGEDCVVEELARRGHILFEPRPQ